MYHRRIINPPQQSAILFKYQLAKSLRIRNVEVLNGDGFTECRVITRSLLLRAK
jgi:hypothetical protein